MSNVNIAVKASIPQITLPLLIGLFMLRVKIPCESIPLLGQRLPQRLIQSWSPTSDLTRAKPPTPPTDQLIHAAVKAEHPSTVGDLWRVLKTRYDVDEDWFMETVKSMVTNGGMELRKPEYRFETFLDYLFTLSVSGWLWTTFAAVSLSVVAVATVPVSSPLAPVRWLLGSLFVLYLPGFALLRLLFPAGSELDSLERFALNLGVSLAVVLLVGLVLNFTPWGIRFEPIVASLALFTLCFAGGAGLREYFAVGS
jgi:Protein of unknown function (DUF1616)